MNGVIELVRPSRPSTLKTVEGFKRHNKYITVLSKLAMTVEPVANARIAAALVYKNDIVAFGMNRRKTHPFQALYGRNKDSIYLHAETDCIKHALKEISVDILPKCTLYICRVKYSNNTDRKFVMGMAKPCEGCARAIANFNINKVVFSQENNTIGML